MTYIISTLFYWFVWYHFDGNFITWLLGYFVLVYAYWEMIRTLMSLAKTTNRKAVE